MNAAEAIANGLAAAGCKHVFGMPGGEVLALLDEVAGAVEAAVKSAPNYWPEGEDRQQAIEMLSNSKKPIILAGLGAVIMRLSLLFWP